MRIAPIVAKEVRALLPLTSLAIGVIVAAGALPLGNNGRFVAFLTYCVSPTLLGAWSIGHEFTHRTLSSLLTQPIARRNVLLIKMAVLSALMAVVVFSASLVIPSADLHGAGLGTWTSVRGFLPVLIGLGLAPALTVAARGALPGAIFTVAVPAVLAITGELIGIARYGLLLQDAPLVRETRLFLLQWGTAGAVIIGAVLTWRLFGQVEIVDGAQALTIGRRQRAATAPDVAHTRSRVWLLVAKEVRLQPMAFVVAGLFIVAWATLWLTRNSTDFDLVPIGQVVRQVYIALVAVLLGASASAEERQLRTLDWQQLLPLATWKQWSIKVVTTFGLTALLAIALPYIVIGFLPLTDSLPERWAMAAFGRRDVIWMTFVLASASLYVSTLSTSGIRALVVTAPVFMAATTVTITVNGVMFFALMSHAKWVQVAGPLDRAGLDRIEMLTTGLWWLTAAAFLGVLLYAGLVNHRLADRRLRRIAAQVACIFSAFWLVSIAQLFCTLLDHSALRAFMGRS